MLHNFSALQCCRDESVLEMFRGVKLELFAVAVKLSRYIYKPIKYQVIIPSIEEFQSKNFLQKI